MLHTGEKELNALLSLLDDTDRDVFEHVSERLVTFGKDVIPKLEDHWSHALDPLLQERLEDIIHKIQFHALKADMDRWSRHETDDLLRGLILVARFQYPDLDEDRIHQTLTQLKESAVIETQMHHVPIEKVYALNRVFFEFFGFRGNTAHFHSPQNSFINIVLESRKGNPLMLACLYSIVARHAGMPVYGVNLPEHFVVAYRDESTFPRYEYTYPEGRVLFYINAFNRGHVIRKGDIEKFLGKLGLRSEKAYFTPCNNMEILRRSFRNLAYAYRKTGEESKLLELDRLAACLSGR